MMLCRTLGRTGRALPRVGRAAARSMASVTDGLELGLPDKFGHFINGEFCEPDGGQYFDNVSPVRVVRAAQVWQAFPRANE